MQNSTTSSSASLPFPPGPVLKREVRAGLTTFATMAYIVVLNPAILGDAGMPAGGVLVATCLAAATGSILMGLLANYPFALAPGMGLNAFFAYTLVLGEGLSWQAALAAVFVSGVIFVILTLTKLREAVIDGIPSNLKHAVGGGIGLFIALIGLRNAGLIAYNPGTRTMGRVNEGHLSGGDLAQYVMPGVDEAAIGLAIFGLVVTAALVARKVPGALLYGILATTLAGIPLGVVAPESWALVSMPSGLGDTFLQLDFQGLFAYGLITAVFTFTFVDLFDTAGTLVGVAGKAKMLDEEGRLPRAKRALMADSVATVTGSLLGTSTTTTYVESAAGVAEGGRTGWTAITVGVLFLVALFFGPLVQLVPSAATAAALILVGVFMMGAVARIDFKDPVEAIPAFLTIAFMPLTFSIAEGISVGIISCVALRLLSGRTKQISLTLWVMFGLFVLRYFL